MSIDEEREVRQRLGAALDGMTPSPAPVAATLRRGRTLRVRRRIGVAAGLAVAVGVGLAVPILGNQFVRQAPVSPGRPAAVNSPGRLGPRGRARLVGDCPRRSLGVLLHRAVRRLPGYRVPVPGQPGQRLHWT